MARFDDDDFDLSGKNAAIAQLIGTVFGLVAGSITGLVIGIAFVGGTLGALFGIGVGLITGSILGYVIATVNTSSPNSKREGLNISQETEDRERNKESYSSTMGPLLVATNKAREPAPEFSGPQEFDLRKLRTSASDTNTGTPGATMNC